MPSSCSAAERAGRSCTTGPTLAIGSFASFEHRRQPGITWQLSKVTVSQSFQGNLMPAWVWILIIAAIVVVVAVIAMMAFRQRRTAMLRERFGEESERTVNARDNRRAAEADLRGRERQRAQFEVKPLPERARARFAAEWRDVQERFVDEPSAAVASADILVYRVMGARGYPMENFEAQADLVSVDHPDVVQNYRAAHGIYERSQSQQATTEDLRAAVLHYRTLFDHLLQPERETGDGAQQPDDGDGDGQQVAE